MPDQVAAALAFLQRDVLKNIVPLKMLHAYSPAITCHYLERGAEAGVVEMLPPTVFSYDAEAYPDADWIVLLSTTGPAAAEVLLDLVPARAALVFKLFDPADYQNFGPVWEIAGVYTSPEARRAGLGRRVVAAALHTLTQRGLTPRYHVNEDNAPSVGLAQALGLVPFVTIEHFVSNAHAGGAA